MGLAAALTACVPAWLVAFVVTVLVAERVHASMNGKKVGFKG